MIVVVNGVLCHECGYVEWDVAWNVILISYVNATTTHPHTLSLTLLAISLFFVNCYRDSPLLHILGVQLPLAYCLYRWDE